LVASGCGSFGISVFQFEIEDSSNRCAHWLNRNDFRSNKSRPYTSQQWERVFDERSSVDGRGVFTEHVFFSELLEFRKLILKQLRQTILGIRIHLHVMSVSILFRQPSVPSLNQFG